MYRILASASALLLAGSTLSAQCFETNFGTQLGTGDDTLFALQPMNITFPMGGVAASYTHIHVGTNGVAYLTNGAASGASTTGYSTSATTILNNLRGLAGQPPRIAPYWRDLNFTVANSGAVFLNNTLAGKCVVTWRNAVHFNQTSPIFTIQAQLFADGRVTFFYNGTIQNTALVPICGISEGNLIADPGATDLSVATSGVSTSKLVYQSFATLNTFDLQTTLVTFSPNSGGGYDTSPSPCVPAATTSYGSGCVNKSATVYESFAANAFDLSNSSIRLTLNGVGGYDASVGSAGFFTHTVPGLALTDDSVATVALPSALAYPGGSTSSIGVCSNGFIWMQTPNTGNDWTPTVAELFSAAGRLCAVWNDLVPDGATNVNNVFAEHDAVNNKFYVTWLNLPTFAAGGNATLQVELNLTNNEVEIRYQACTIPQAAIVGWAPGTGASVVDPGNRDVSATLPGGFSTTSVEIRALGLAVAPTPVLGGPPATYTTSNIPGTALLSLLIFSAADFPAPGVDLTGAGAPGCALLVQFPALASVATVGSPSTVVILGLPADTSLVGANLYAQAATVNFPSNPLGVITSNALRSVLNIF